MTRFLRVQHKPSVTPITRPRFRSLAAGTLLCVACSCDDAELVGVRSGGGAGDGAGDTGGSAGSNGGKTSNGAAGGTIGSSGSESSPAAGDGGTTGEGGTTDTGGAPGQGGTTDGGGTTGEGGTTDSAGATGEGGGAGDGGVVDYVRYLYAADGGSGTISIYGVSASTGKMSSRGYALAGLSPMQLLASPDQQFLFAASNSGSVGAYSLHPKSGWPTPAAGSPYAAGSGTVSAALHPAGTFLYAASSGSDNVTAFAIDDASGALTPIGSPVTVGAGPSACVVSPDGAYLYVANKTAETVSTLSIDQGSGALTPVGSPAPTGIAPTSIAVNPDGSALYVGFIGTYFDFQGGVNSYSIDPSTGALTAVDTEFATTAEIDTSLAVTPSGKYLLAAYLGLSDLAVYETGPGGTLTIVDPDPYDVASPADVIVDHSGSLVFVSDYAQNEVYSLALDQQTGAVTPVGGAVDWRGAYGAAIVHGSQPLNTTSAYALVTNQDDDTVSTYAIASDGTLVPGGTEPTANNPVGVGLNPDGSLAVVTSETGNAAASYDADPTTGELVATGSSASTATQPLVVALDPSGRFAFTSNFGSNSVSRLSVAADGTLASLGTTGLGGSPVGLAMHPTGAYLYVALRGVNYLGVFGVNGSTGALAYTCCAPQPLTGSDPAWVAVSPSGGRVYVTNFGSNDLSVFGVDTLNNGLYSGTKFATGAAPFGIAVDPLEQYLFVANSADDTVTRFDTRVWPMTNLGATPTGGLKPMTLATDGSGEHLYVVNQDSNDITVFTIDRATGDLTPLGDRVPTGNRPATIAVHASFE